MIPEQRGVRVWGVVPAAGHGVRMGGPKQVMPWGATTMTAVVVSRLLEAGVAGVVVVTRTVLREQLGLPADGRVCVALNDRPDSQMLDSVRVGLEALPAPGHDRGDAAGPGPHDGVLVVPADMPELTAASSARCIAAYRDHPDRIVIATHRGRRGHPVIFPLALRAELSTLSAGLRELARCHAERVSLVACDDDPGVLRDIDHPPEDRRAPPADEQR